MEYADPMPASDPTIAALGEEAIIRILAADSLGAAPEGVLVPNGDDAAAYRPSPGQAQVLTTDALTDGVHFDRGYTPARAVGHRLMAVNLSDLAAMGATPRFALLSVVLPRTLRRAWLSEVAEGLHATARAHGVLIVGGNVSRSDAALVLDATLVGEAEPDRLVRREGANPGDDLWVSGELGGAAGALAALAAGRAPEAIPAALLERLFWPQPRVGLGQALAAAGVARAMCDVSDGLARDLAHLLASGLGCRVEAAALPRSAALAELGEALGRDPLDWITGGGEEYELLFAARPEDRAAVEAVGAEVGVPVARVGVVDAAGAGRTVEASGGARPLAGGFDHFASEEDE